MMDGGRRARLIAEIVRFLEDLDANELKGNMGAEGSEADPKAGMAIMVEGEGGMPPKDEMMEMNAVPAEEEEMDEDELEELAKLSS